MKSKLIEFPPRKYPIVECDEKDIKPVDIQFAFYENAVDYIEEQQFEDLLKENKDTKKYFIRKNLKFKEYYEVCTVETGKFVEINSFLELKNAFDFIDDRKEVMTQKKEDYRQDNYRIAYDNEKYWLELSQGGEWKTVTEVADTDEGIRMINLLLGDANDD